MARSFFTPPSSSMSILPLTSLLLTCKPASAYDAAASITLGLSELELALLLGL